LLLRRLDRGLGASAPGFSSRPLKWGAPISPLLFPVLPPSRSTRAGSPGRSNLAPGWRKTGLSNHASPQGSTTSPPLPSLIVSGCPEEVGGEGRDHPFCVESTARIFERPPPPVRSYGAFPFPLSDSFRPATWSAAVLRARDDVFFLTSCVQVVHCVPAHRRFGNHHCARYDPLVGSTATARRLLSGPRASSLIREAPKTACGTPLPCVRSMRRLSAHMAAAVGRGQDGCDRRSTRTSASRA